MIDVVQIHCVLLLVFMSKGRREQPYANLRAALAATARKNHTKQLELQDQETCKAYNLNVLA